MVLLKLWLKSNIGFSSEGLYWTLYTYLSLFLRLMFDKSQTRRSIPDVVVDGDEKFLKFHFFFLI